MMRRSVTLLLILMMVVLWPRYPSTCYQSESQQATPLENRARKRRAIVVGISRYVGLDRALHASVDAKLFLSTLRDASQLEEPDVRLLLDQKATLYEIRTAFEELAGQPLDVVYFYFAGLGVGDQAYGYLLSADANLDQPTSKSLSVAELRGKLERISANMIILIVDASYDERIGHPLKLSSPRENQIMERLKAISKELRRVSVIPAPSLGELSENDRERKYSAFTKHLVSGVRGEADRNRDGRVQAGELSTFMQEYLEQRPVQPQEPPETPSIPPTGLETTQPKTEQPTRVQLTEPPPFQPPHSSKPPCRPTPNLDPRRISQLGEIVQANPNDVKARYELGKAYIELCLYEQAKHQFKFIITDLGRDEFDAHIALAIVYEELGQLEEARQEYQHAIRLRPTEPTIYYNLGLLYYKMEDDAEAVRQYDEAVKLGLDRKEEAYYARGLAHQRQGNHEKAIADYRRAIELNTGWVEPRKALAQVFESLGRYEEAVGEYQKVIEMNSSDSYAYWRIGLCYEFLGKAQEAIGAYKKALDIDPTGQAAGFDPGTLHKRIQALEARSP